MGDSGDCQFIHFLSLKLRDSAHCSPSTGRAPRHQKAVPCGGLRGCCGENPTNAERILWRALATDRRFAGKFKRQTPVGRHIPDFVSFVHRVAIELINPDESATIVAARAARRAWLASRDYRVIEIRAVDVEADLSSELERLAAELTQSG